MHQYSLDRHNNNAMMIRTIFFFSLHQYASSFIAQQSPRSHRIAPPSPPDIAFPSRLRRSPFPLHSSNADDDEIEEYDDGFTNLLAQKKDRDLSGSSLRQFNLGFDLMISNYAGSMGFDEVVDWEYFDNPGEERRNIVDPPPLDPTKPKRTRSSSGSVVRIFRGELLGYPASALRSSGKDYRIIVKEFSGDTAMELAEMELRCISKIQSVLCEEKDERARHGKWADSAVSRYVLGRTKGSIREDDTHLVKFMEYLTANGEFPFVGILGTLNLDDYFTDSDEVTDPAAKNEWYRALGTPPPKPGSIWLVYEYAGLVTAGSYSQPPLVRRSKIPPTKGFFGSLIMPPPLPPWKERANFVVKGVLRKALEAVAVLHENGIAHRSLGSNSIILSSTGLDKTEAASIYNVNPDKLVLKLSDFGFAGLISESSLDESFRVRAKGFGIDVNPDQFTSIAENSFAIAEDLHALGFVFLGILLSTLAEPPSATFAMPKTDEDTLQRQLGEIFNKDMEEFRDYCDAEEIWFKVVELLDDKDGWDVLNKMCYARERAGEMQGSLQFLTARGLLSHPFFDNGR